MIFAMALAAACAPIEPTSEAVTAATTATRARGLRNPGHALVTLHPAADVRLIAPPGRFADAGSYAGLATITVARRGALIVALSERAYIDLFKGDVRVASTSHGRPPVCPGVPAMRKQVRFDVAPGRYAIQLTGSARPRLQISIAATD